MFPEQRVVQAGYHFEFAASFQAMRVGRQATILPAGAEGDSEMAQFVPMDNVAGAEVAAQHFGQRLAEYWLLGR